MRRPGIGPLAAVVVPGGVLALLSTTVVGVAVPGIAAEFPGGAGEVHWVATVALLAAGIAIPVSGWASTRFGVRVTWLVAVAVFAAGSAAAALAPDLGTLIAARVVQGLGGGALEPVMLSALARASGPARMGRVMGVSGAAMALGPLLGPLLGGILIESVGWRWIFAGIALAAVVLLIASIAVLRDTYRAPALLDLPGLLLLAVASVSLLAGLSRAATPAALDAITIAEIAIGLLALVSLIAWARLRGDAAIIDLATFTARGFTPGVLVMALLGAAIYPLLFGLPQFYQSAAGFSPIVAGLLLAPYALGQLAAMPVTGWVSDRIGARSLVIGGAILTAAATGAFILVGTSASAGWYATLSLALGIGVGSIGGPAVGATYRNLPAHRIPAGSTILFLTNQFGGALGIALLAGIIQLGSDHGTWDATLGTTPLLLPAAAAIAISIVATRLGGRTE